MNPRNSLAIAAMVAAAGIGMGGGAAITPREYSSYSRGDPSKRSRDDRRRDKAEAEDARIPKCCRQYAKRYANTSSLKLGKKANSLGKRGR